MKVLKLAIIVVGGLLMLSLSCWAQEETQRHQQQIVIQGSGFFGSSRSRRAGYFDHLRSFEEIVVCVLSALKLFLKDSLNLGATAPLTSYFAAFG